MSNIQLAAEIVDLAVKCRMLERERYSAILSEDAEQAKTKLQIIEMRLQVAVDKYIEATEQ